MDALFVRVPMLCENELRQLWGNVTPDSILALTGYLAPQGYECRVLDLCLDAELSEPPPDEDLAARYDALADAVADDAARFRPRLLGFTCLSNPEGRVTLEVAARLRDRLPGLPIVLGGYFPTSNAPEILEHCPAVDAVVVGEGEIAAREMLRRLRDGLDPFAPDVPNLCYRSADGEFVHTPAAGVFELRTAPGMDYASLPHAGRYQTLAYHTSRGCPWRCSYCLEVSMGKPYRMKTLETVRRDVQAFQAVNERFFLLLTDPMLAISDQRILELCDLFEELGVQYLFETRVDALSPAVLPRLKASGCNSVYFGFESASFDTLLRMNKLKDYGQYERYLDGAVELVRACARSGVIPMLGVMVGYPGETQEDLRFTHDFLRRLRGIYLQSVEPGTAGAGFVVSPSEVYLLRSSAIDKVLGFFTRKGMTTTGGGVFDDVKVRSASNYLSEAEVQLFLKAFSALSVQPALSEAVAGPTALNSMTATLSAQVRSREAAAGAAD